MVGLRNASEIAVGPPTGVDFDGFYAAHFQSLTIQLYAYTGDLPTAQDVVQEAFYRAFARWTRVSGMDDPVAWIRRVAWNLATSQWRRARTAADSSVRPAPAASASTGRPRLPFGQTYSPSTTAPAGGISVAELNDSKVDVPPWAPDAAAKNCPFGSVQFTRGQGGNGHLQIDNVAYADIDHDGRNETMARIHCIGTPPQFTSQVVARSTRRGPSRRQLAGRLDPDPETHLRLTAPGSVRRRPQQHPDSFEGLRRSEQPERRAHLRDQVPELRTLSDRPAAP